MSWNIELVLNTDIKRFEAWLERYRLQTLPFYTNLENGKTLHIVGAPTFRGQHQDLRMHEIKAHIGKPSATNPEAIELSYSFPVIELELFEPAANRINVKLKCKHEGLFHYHIGMLEEISKLWPETRATILDYLDQFLPTEANKMQMVMAIAKGYKEFHKVSNKNFETLKNRLVSLLENNYFMSDTKTGESIDIQSTTVSSGSKGNIDFYHIYVQGQINGKPVRHLATFELQGKFGADLDTYMSAIYLDNEPYLEKYIGMMVAKLLPDSKFLECLVQQPSHPSKPDGYEILSDSTGGTALYKRDEQGKISDVKPLPNPGWTFEVGSKSIALKPEHIELNHTTGDFQPDLYPPSLKDALINITSETLAGLTKNTNSQATQDNAAKTDTTQLLPPINAEGLEKVKELSKQGLTVKVIAQRASLSESTVKRYRKILGLQRRK